MAANLGIRSPPPLPSLRSPAQPPRSSPFPRLGRASPTDLGTAAPPFKPLVSWPRCLGGAAEIRAGTGCEAEEGEVRSGGETVRTLLIDNYDSYTYNIYQELSVVNGEPPVVVHNDEWTLEQIKNSLYEEKAFDNIVISPGPGSPSCAADIGICLQILLDCADIPILGVCLGHQALGFVHGAKVIHAPEPIHGRLSEIEHTGCSLFRDIPSGRNSGFKVVRYHSLVIDAETLPKELIPIAWTTSVRTLSFLETHRFDSFVNQANKLQSVGHFTGSLEDAGLSDGCNITGMVGRKVIMGVMHSARPHYGVQFHPESIATHYGRKIFENFKRMTVNYGLMSSSHQERKVLYERQSCKEPSKRKTSCNKASRNHELDLWPNPVLTRKTVDDKYIRLQWMKIDCLVSQVGGAENIFHYLFGEKNAENTFWLDSSSTDQGRARFSFMGGKGGPLWKQLTFRLSAESKTSKVGGYLSIQDVHGSVKKRFLKDGLFDFLNKELQSFQYDKEDYEGLPFDFYGGYIGFIGYDLKVECGAPSNTYKSTTPDACFFFADNLVVIDHNNGDVYILCIHDIYHSDTDLGLRDCSKEKSWLVETEKRLMQLKAMWRLKAMSSKKFNMIKFPGGSSVPCKGSFVVEKSRQQYVNDVEKCLKFIRDGESYELCLTTQMRKRVRDLNALRLYLNLRDRNPAPYAAWLNFANENLCICCSSPERFLRLDANGTLEAKPIKGTIARGQTPEEDEHLRLQLQFSEKDQAENLMIVDLLRNDLGRVCKPGSVTVPRLMEVESYATVHTLVSTVQGKRKPEVSPINCVRAAFPGGSMTGAPKLRSMELLDSLENSSRGIYSGSIGFFSYNQTFDLNIVIRTVVIHDGEVSVGAGGAIVAMSNPEAEYEEMMLKAKAPTIAVEECSKDLDHSSQALKMAI